MDNPVVRVLLKGRVLQEVPFSGQTLRIGRMKENDIVVNNLAVSRFHAALVREGGRLVFEDLGSENGSFVNGTRVERDVTVSFGDDIQIGKHQLVILPAQVAAAPTPPQPSRAVSDAWDDNETYVSDGPLVTDPGATGPGFQAPAADAPTAPQPALPTPPAAAAPASPASPAGNPFTAASVDEAGMDEIDLLLGARAPQPKSSDLVELGGDGADELDALLSGGDLGDLAAAGPGTLSGQDETLVAAPPTPPPAVAEPEFEGLEEDDLAGELPHDLTVDDDDLLPSLHTGSTPSVDPNERTAEQSAPVGAAPDLDEQTMLAGPPSAGGSVADVSLPWEVDSTPVPESSPDAVTVLDAAPPELPAPPPIEAAGPGEAAPMATAPGAAPELPPTPDPAPPSAAADFDPVLDDGPGESDDASLFDFAVDEDLTALQPAALPQPAAAAPPTATPADSAPSQPSGSGSDPNAQLPHVGMIIHRSGELEQMVPWDRDVLCAGRADECEIQLGAAEVSRRHALFVREGGAFTVRDLNSINGIFVNGERVDHRALSVGDVVRIEDYELTFLRDRKPLSVPAESVMTEPATAQSEAQGLTMTVLDPAPPESVPEPVPTDPAPAFASPGFAIHAGSAASATSDAPTPLPPAFAAAPEPTDVSVDVPEMDLFPVPISRPGIDPAPVAAEDPAAAPPDAAPEPVAGFAAPQPDAGPAFEPPSFEVAPDFDAPAPFDALAPEADHEAPTQPPEMPDLDDEQDFPVPAGTGSFFQSAPGPDPAASAVPSPEASPPEPPAEQVVREEPVFDQAPVAAPATAPLIHTQAPASPEPPFAPSVPPPASMEPPMAVQGHAPELLPEPASAPQPTGRFSMSEAGPELPFSLDPAPAPEPAAPAPEADPVLAPPAPESQPWPSGPTAAPADSFAAPPASAAEEPLTDAPSEVDFAQPVAPVPTLPPFVIPSQPETSPEPAPPEPTAVPTVQSPLADPTPPAMTEVDLLAEDEPDEKDLPHAHPEDVQQMRTRPAAAEENASPLARAAATVTAQSVSETVAAAVEALPPLRLELKLRTDHLPEPLRSALDGLLGGELRLPIEIRLSTGAPRLEDKAG